MASIAKITRELGDEQYETVGDSGRSLSQLVVVVSGFLVIGADTGWAWHKLGEERQRPLGTLTAGDTARNVIKLLILLWGIAFISAVFRKLIGVGRKS